MTTLISWRTAGGESGRCDAKCYDAAGPGCDCICRGANHGVGWERALEHTRDQVLEIIEGYSGMPGLQTRVNAEARQLTLWRPGS